MFVSEKYIDCTEFLEQASLSHSLHKTFTKTRTVLRDKQDAG